MISDSTKNFSSLGYRYRIESDYGVALVFVRYEYDRSTDTLKKGKHYWVLKKWFNYWFQSNGWHGRYELLGWQQFPSGVRFLVENFEPNAEGEQLLELRPFGAP